MTRFRPAFLIVPALLGAGACAPAAESAREPAGAAAADTARFYEWWTRTYAADVGPGGDTLLVPMPPEVRRTDLRLESLRAPRALERLRPAEAQGEHWRAGALHQRAGEVLAVWVPTDSTGFPSDPRTCARHRTWIGIVPDGRWASLELVPYCSETYGPEEVDLGLLWLGDEAWPHVEVTWNAPACVPSALYRYDPASRQYGLARRTCRS